MKALITGASAGIGRDIARDFAKRGYELILVARREDRLLALKEEFQTNVEVIPMDLTRLENCRKLFEMTSMQDIDILVNNAGFGWFGDYIHMPDDVLLSMIDLNIASLSLLCRLYGEWFAKKNRGIILNVASAAAFAVGPLMSEYYASKSYVYKLSLGLYQEFKKQKKKVQVSVLCPGPVATEFNDVAHVKFKLKSQSSEWVAHYAVEKTLKGKIIIVPSKMIAIGKFFSRFVSDKMLARIGYHFQKQKKDKKGAASR